MKDIPLDAQVECADGPCGESGIVILNPETRVVTHFVVQDKALPHRDKRLVLIDQVVETSRNLIRLSCTKAELAVRRGTKVAARDDNVGQVAEPETKP